MILEVVQKEHIPKNTSVVTGRGKVVKGVPDGPTSEEGGHLPIN